MRVATTPFSSGAARHRAGRSYGILSTYPPTPCGLATFTAALASGLEVNGATVGVVRVADGETSSDPRVLAEMENDVPASVAKATARLSG
ncbi:glycosyltransferase, group I, partial [mine drainage metagenome]